MQKGVKGGGALLIVSVCCCKVEQICFPLSFPGGFLGLTRDRSEPDPRLQHRSSVATHYVYWIVIFRERKEVSFLLKMPETERQRERKRPIHSNRSDTYVFSRRLRVPVAKPGDWVEFPLGHTDDQSIHS